MEKIKRKISNSALLKWLAEPLLNGYVYIRFLITRVYTKLGEDKDAVRLLCTHFGLKLSEIKYFDIGANHFMRGNNTYLIYRRGGRGVLVEANPDMSEILEKHRIGDKVLNAAITDQSNGEQLVFYVCSLPTRSTLDPECARNLKERGFSIEREVLITSVSFEQIVEQVGFVPDLLSIDVEGYDLRVLKSIDFNKYPIKVIIAEEDKGMKDYMESQGYICAKKYASNYIFYKSN